MTNKPDLLRLIRKPTYRKETKMNHRCVNHVFGYCLDPELVTVETIIKDLHDFGGTPYKAPVTTYHCPQDWHTCPHLQFANDHYLTLSAALTEFQHPQEAKQLNSPRKKRSPVKTT